MLVLYSRVLACEDKKDLYRIGEDCVKESLIGKRVAENIVIKPVRIRNPNYLAQRIKDIVEENIHTDNPRFWNNILGIYDSNASKIS